MSIWYYGEHREWIKDRDLVFEAFCHYCKTPLSRDVDDESDAVLSEIMNYGMSDNFSTTADALIGICPACGWWKYGFGTNVRGRPAASFEFSAGILRSLDLTDVSIPLHQVRDYLTADRKSTRLNSSH